MLDSQLTVARIVLDHSECARVFSRHRIDFCCRGGVSVEAACQELGLDAAGLLRELEQAIADRSGEAQTDPRTLSTPALVAQIVATHHRYLREAMPFLGPLAAKVARVHGDHNPALRDLHAVVEQLFAALGPHLDAEEEVLFPELTRRSPDTAVVTQELATMHVEHLAVGALLQRMRDAADGYAAPDWACNSYRGLFAELAKLEEDVLRHVHLENHVLMPRFAAA